MFFAFFLFIFSSDLDAGRQQPRAHIAMPWGAGMLV
jgi:hypothetical protein